MIAQKHLTRQLIRVMPTDAAHIIQTVSRYFGICPGELLGPRRFQSIVYARMVCYLMFYRRTDYTLSDIGWFMGGRDHTTVLHGISVIEYESGLTYEGREQIREVERILGGPAFERRAFDHNRVPIYGSNGERWPSIRAAATSLKRSLNCIYANSKSGGSVNGVRLSRKPFPAVVAKGAA